RLDQTDLDHVGVTGVAVGRVTAEVGGQVAVAGTERDDRVGEAGALDRVGCGGVRPHRRARACRCTPLIGRLAELRSGEVQGGLLGGRGSDGRVTGAGAGGVV